MAFKIETIRGWSVLAPDPVDGAFDGAFIDTTGRRYTALFDGHNVRFHDGAGYFVGRWLQGTPATIVRQTSLLPPGFTFTFMDHGHAPQRLHATWEYDGPFWQAVESWKQAGFSLSNVERYFNPNHPRASIHLRTKGARATGADSSHVILPSSGSSGPAAGEIHVGEFNPFTGLGLGFALHHLERWFASN